MYSIVYTQTALYDLSTIYDFITESDEIYASKVVDTIYAFVSYLALFPSLGIVIEDAPGLRLIVEPSFRYRIVYTVDNNTILIRTISKYRDM